MKTKRTKARRPAQMLEPVTLSRCVVCGKLVKWRIKKTYKCSDGRHCILYLKCPTEGCEGRAKQLQDVSD